MQIVQINNTEEPLVSVIIPIYRVEQYLYACVDSIINQTYKNLEIILVDDGSPDSCPKICDEYAKKDDRIHVLHKPNGGLSDARNAGIKIARGEYLCFVDSDDIIHNQMVEVLMTPLINDKNLKISACQSESFNDGEVYDAKQNIKSTEIIDYNLFFTKRFWTTAWCKIYKRELFRSIRYPVGRIHEDEFTTYKICYAAQKIAYTESKLLFYRQRGGSIINNISAKRIIDLHDALKGQVDFFLEQKEIKLYAKFLVNFASAYSRYVQYKKTFEESNKILVLWKKELKKYKIKSLSVEQKIKYILYCRFPMVSYLMSKIHKKNQ